MSYYELTIRSRIRFRETFAPLLDEMASLYWLLDLVAGPFSLHEHPRGLEDAEEGMISVEARYSETSYPLQLDWGHWQISTIHEAWWNRLREGIDPGWIAPAE